MSESLITKKALAAGLKELTQKKSFDKITIQDITDTCGLNRQTFYYHFQDKFELVDWIYHNEVISKITNDLNYNNWNEKIMEMLVKMKSDQHFYGSTLKQSAESCFRENLFRIGSELFLNMINGMFINESFGEDEKNFISEFYAFGIVGVIVAWVQRGMKETPEHITMQLENVSYGTQRFAVARFTENLESC